MYSDVASVAILTTVCCLIEEREHQQEEKDEGGSIFHMYLLYANKHTITKEWLFLHTSILNGGMWGIPIACIRFHNKEYFMPHYDFCFMIWNL